MNPLNNQLPMDQVLAEVAQPVLRYLERYVGNRALAEDLQQETLVRVSGGYASFAARSSIKTWAFSIANRVAADYFRHPDQQRLIVELDEAIDVANPDPDISDQLIETQMNQCMREVIDSLPGNYRAVLILHDLEGLSVEQTAQICECTLANAKIRLHRARNRLKEALGKQCSFYHDDGGAYRCDRKD